MNIIKPSLLLMSNFSLRFLVKVIWKRLVILLVPITFSNLTTPINSKYRINLNSFPPINPTKVVSDMKILLDENCANLKILLLEMSWEVYTVKEVLSRKAGSNSVPDSQILNYALKNKTIIVTKDKEMNIRCLEKSIPFVDLG